MYFHDAKNLNEALEQVRHEDFHSIRKVAAVVEALRPFIDPRLDNTPLFAFVLTRIIDDVQARGVLEQPNPGNIIAQMIRELLSPAKPRPSASHGCADCDSSSEWPVTRRNTPKAAYVPFMQPVSERLVTLPMGTGLRTPYRSAQGLFSCDHYHPALDRAAVRRMVRSLGPDFGPEPPSGGSLARV